jgi:hypothetical protein
MPEMAVFSGNKEARLEGLEPPTRCLEGSCSIHLSYRRVAAGVESGRADLNRRPPAPKAGALARLRHSPFREILAQEGVKPKQAEDGVKPTFFTR